MRAENLSEHVITMPADVAQNYISQMLEELSLIAHNAGRKDLASLLRATIAASRIDEALGPEA